MFWTKTKNGLHISIYLQPKASRNEIVGLFQGQLKVKVKAPPVDGAANKELILLLAKVLKVPKSDLTLVRGLSSKHKVIQYEGEDESAVLAVLDQINV